MAPLPCTKVRLKALTYRRTNIHNTIYSIHTLGGGNQVTQKKDMVNRVNRFYF